MQGNPLWPHETDFPMLAGDLTVDVAIVGGGIAGISAAYFLGAKGYKVALIERDQIGSAATGASSGTLFHGSGLGFKASVEQYGMEKTEVLIKETDTAIKDMMELIEEEKIDCGLRTVNLIDVAKDESEMEHVNSEAEISSKLGIESKLLQSDELEEVFKVKPFALGIERFCAQIRPGRLVAALAKIMSSRYGVQIYENTRMFGFNDNGSKATVKTENGTITANKLIIATNIEDFEGIEKHFKIENSTVVPSKPLGDRMKDVFNKEKIIETIGDQYDMFYPLDGRILFEVYDPKNIQEKVKQYFPSWVEFEFDNMWGDSWSKTKDNLPIVGNVTSNIISAVGMGDQGIVMGYASGKKMKDIIDQKSDEFLEMMSPKRLVKE